MMTKQASTDQRPWSYERGTTVSVLLIRLMQMKNDLQQREQILRFLSICLISG